MVRDLRRSIRDPYSVYGDHAAGVTDGLRHGTICVASFGGQKEEIDATTRLNTRFF